nr:MAG TPA: hypothetical protein [Caudoviricetes sp.]
MVLSGGLGERICAPLFFLWKIMWRKYVAAIVVILLNHGTKPSERYYNG